MPTKRSSIQKKAIRTRKAKSAGRKTEKKKRRAVAREAAANKKVPSVIAEVPQASDSQEQNVRRLGPGDDAERI